MDLSNFLNEKLPQYYKANDTYKDGNDKGILERFLGILGIELQDEFITPLEQLIDQLDPTTAADQYLSLLAFTVGNPEDILGDTDSYRTRLTQAITLYKNKGTVKSYRVLFALLGYTVNVVDHIPSDMIYDNGNEYDTGLQYDTDRCSLGCIEYSLEYSNIPGRTSGPLDSGKLDQLTRTIERDLQPINTRLRDIIFV